jgi:hypothetical protein
LEACYLGFKKCEFKSERVVCNILARSSKQFCRTVDNTDMELNRTVTEQDETEDGFEKECVPINIGLRRAHRKQVLDGASISHKVIYFE